MDVHSLPAVNATLNGIAAILLLIAYVLIRQGRIQAHRRVMLTAFGVSVAFLICYLIYHSQTGVLHYAKTGPIRIAYFSLLMVRRACWQGQLSRAMTGDSPSWVGLAWPAWPTWPVAASLALDLFSTWPI